MAGFEPESAIETAGQKLALVFSADMRGVPFRFRKAKERARALLEHHPKGGAR
jgi:hypothetical protein